jgi:hypothetical protein
LRKKRPRKIDDPAIKHNVPTHCGHKTVIHKGQEAMSRERKKIKEMRKGHEASAAATATKLLEKKNNNNHQPTVNTLLACSSETGSTGKTAGKWQKEEEIPEYPTHTKKKTAIVLHRKRKTAKPTAKHTWSSAMQYRERENGEWTSAKREKGRKEEMDDGYPRELVLHVLRCVQRSVCPSVVSHSPLPEIQFCSLSLLPSGLSPSFTRLEGPPGKTR